MNPTEQDGRQAVGVMVDLINELLAQMGPITKKCVITSLNPSVQILDKILTNYGQVKDS